MAYSPQPNPYTDKTPTSNELYNLYQDAFTRYRNNAGNESAGAVGRALGKSGAITQGTFGLPAEKVGLSNLLQMLLQQGRVDPRLMALAQGANARETQQAQTGAQGLAAQKGFGGSGLAAALQGAIGQAGANRATNLRYQDISDSYQRNQENLGLLNQLVLQPQLGYASLGQADADSVRQAKEKRIATGASLIGGGLGAFAR